MPVYPGALPTPPHSDSGEGDCFRGLTTVRLRYDLLLCLPSVSELTRFSSSQRGRLLPGFRRFGHPRRRWISLQCQLGNLHWRDFHPLRTSTSFTALAGPPTGFREFQRGSRLLSADSVAVKAPLVRWQVDRTLADSDLCTYGRTSKRRASRTQGLPDIHQQWR